MNQYVSEDIRRYILQYNPDVSGILSMDELVTEALDTGFDPRRLLRQAIDREVHIRAVGNTTGGRIHKIVNVIPWEVYVEELEGDNENDDDVHNSNTFSVLRIDIPQTYRSDAYTLAERIESVIGVRADGPYTCPCIRIHASDVYQTLSEMIEYDILLYPNFQQSVNRRSSYKGRASQ